jgi:hypothetical protein
MFQIKLIHGLVSSDEIQRKANELKRKADIKGMVESIKNNQLNDFSSLFRSAGIYDKRKVKR